GATAVSKGHDCGVHTLDGLGSGHAPSIETRRSVSFGVEWWDDDNADLAHHRCEQRPRARSDQASAGRWSSRGGHYPEGSPARQGSTPHRGRVATTRKEALPVKDPRLTVARLDPADREGCRHAVEEASRVTGRLDVLVNNAGYGLVGAVEEISEAEARAILDVDLFGPMWMTQAALPIMRRHGHGHVVQISSTGGVGAMPFLGLYNAAKWGLEGFSEALAA